MSHIIGTPDRNLHKEDGSHRTEPARVLGMPPSRYTVERHARLLAMHMELHESEDQLRMTEQHVTEALEVANGHLRDYIEVLAKPRRRLRRK